MKCKVLPLKKPSLGFPKSMSNQKILFLDFDGPLFNAEALSYPENQPGSHLNICRALGVHPFYDYWKAQTSAVLALNELAHKGFELVISSSWADPRMHTKQEILGILQANAIKMSLAQKWVTDRECSKIRAEQIHQWLSNNPCAQYCIWDDKDSGEGLLTPEKYGLEADCIFLADPSSGFSSDQFFMISSIK